MDIYDIALYVAYFLVFISAIAAVLLPLIYSISSPRDMLKSGLGVVIILLIFLIGYLISDNDVSAKFQSEPFGLTPGIYQAIGGLLISAYCLFVITFVSMLVTEISKAVK